jgi:hypothetical protein
MRPKLASPRTRLHFRSLHTISHKGTSTSLVSSVGNIKSKQVDHEGMCLHSVTKSFPGPEHGLRSSDREDHVVNQDDNAKHYTYDKEKDGNRGFDLYIVRTKVPNVSALRPMLSTA